MLTPELRKQAAEILRAIARDANLPPGQRAEAAQILHELAGGRDARTRRGWWGAITRRRRCAITRRRR